MGLRNALLLPGELKEPPPPPPTYWWSALLNPCWIFSFDRAPLDQLVQKDHKASQWVCFLWLFILNNTGWRWVWREELCKWRRMLSTDVFNISSFCLLTFWQLIFQLIPWVWQDSISSGLIFATSVGKIFIGKKGRLIV